MKNIVTVRDFFSPSIQSRGQLAHGRELNAKLELGRDLEIELTLTTGSDEMIPLLAPGRNHRRLNGAPSKSGPPNDPAAPGSGSKVVRAGRSVGGWSRSEVGAARRWSEATSGRRLAPTARAR